MEEIQFKKLITIREAAVLLGLSSRWIYHRIADGSLPIVKLKGATRIAVADLEKFVDGGRRSNGSCDVS